MRPLKAKILSCGERLREVPRIQRMDEPRGFRDADFVLAHSCSGLLSSFRRFDDFEEIAAPLSATKRLT